MGAVDDLWDVWSLWWSGHSTSSETLWGLSMLWWARIGKGLQFAAAMTVILDLLGPESIRRFANRTNVFSKRAEDLVQERQIVLVAGAPAAILTVVIGVLIGRESDGLTWVTWSLTILGAMLVCLIVVFFAGLVAGGRPRNALIVTSMLVPIMTLGFLLLLYSLVVTPTLRMLVMVLDRERPGHPLRWLAFGLFVVGFHFDLLAT